MTNHLSLDQLAEQAAIKMVDVLKEIGHQRWSPSLVERVRSFLKADTIAILESATQALREQLAQRTRDLDAFLAPVITAPPKWWLTCRDNGHTVSLLEKSQTADEYFCSDCSRGQSSRKAKRARDEHRSDATVLQGYLREFGETPTMTASNRDHWKARAEKAEQQLAHVTTERDEAQAKWRTDFGALTRRLSDATERMVELTRINGAAEAALTAQRQELETLRATMEVARALPFCGHADCAGGQHPATNCIGCEELWNRWEKALAACTPTKSAG